MDDHIVNAADGFVGKNDLGNAVEEFLRRRGAEERFDRVLGRIDSGIEDKDGQRNTDIRVHRKRRELGGNYGEKNDGRGDHVVSAVDRRCFHGGGINDLRPMEVVVHHVRLYDERGEQDDDRRQRAVYGSRVDDALDGGFSEFKAHDTDQERDKESGNIFNTPVPERMVGVGSLARQAEPDECNDRRSRVGEVVERITDDGDRVCQKAHDEFSQEKEKVKENTATSADTADFTAHLRLLRIFLHFWNKFSDQQRNHVFLRPFFPVHFGARNFFLHTRLIIL